MAGGDYHARYRTRVDHPRRNSKKRRGGIIQRRRARHGYAEFRTVGLKGCEGCVRSYSYIKTEAADFESYRGCTSVVELTAYLADRGFDLVAQEPFAEHPNGGRYFELLFRKAK